MQSKLTPVPCLLLFWCAAAPSCSGVPDHSGQPTKVLATRDKGVESRPPAADRALGNTGTVVIDIDSPPPGILANAEKGDLAAMMFLGRIYEDGSGVRQNYQEALRWYQRAAEQAFPPAMRQVCFLYGLGHGLPQDYREAVLWIRKAAELGDEEAMFQLGLAYSNGQGVDRDAKMAARWFRKAAESDHVAAMFGLGVCYGDGIGVEQDKAAAARWYHIAALRGHVDAMINMSVCHAEGRGVPEDLVAAYAWSNVAGASGEVHAEEIREKLKRKMTAKQIADGQEMTRELLAQQQKSNPSTGQEMEKARIKARHYFQQMNHKDQVTPSPDPESRDNASNQRQASD